MASRNRNKKRSGRLSRSPAIIGTVVLILIVVFVAVVAVRYTRHLFMTARYFTITTIVYPDLSADLRHPAVEGARGKNIFTVDLAKMQQQLQARCPHCSDVRVSRRFPDQLLVTARQRRPYAHIAFDRRYIRIDSEGYILGIDREADGQLPVVIGATIQSSSAVVGRPLSDRPVMAALQIIGACRADPVVSAYRLLTIDVGSLSRIYCHFSDGLKVIIDSDEVPRKVQLLGIVISQARLQLDQVNYIDVRFKEPVLSKK